MDSPLVFLEDNIFNAQLAKLIATKGELEGSGLTLQDLRNMIYTRRVKVNPGIPDTGEVPKTKKPGTKKERLSGINVDDFLG